MNEEVIRIEDLLYGIRKRWKMIIVITLFITLISAFISYFVIKPEYETSVKLFIGKEENHSEEYSSSEIQMYQKLMKTYTEIVNTKDLIQDALTKNNIDKSVGAVLSNLSVSFKEDTQLLQIRYKDTVPDKTVIILNAIVKEFMIKSKEIIPNGNVKVIEDARMPRNPISPNKTMNIAMAILFGIIASLGIIFIIEYLDNSFKTVEDVENSLKLPVLGIIPQIDEF